MSETPVVPPCYNQGSGTILGRTSMGPPVRPVDSVIGSPSAAVAAAVTETEGAAVLAAVEDLPLSCGWPPESP